MIKPLIIVIITITIILLIFYINILKKEHFINNNKKWDNYRLADIYKYWSNLKYEKRKFEYIDSIPSKFPESIGTEYVLKNKSKNKNFKLLAKIVNERSKNINNLPTCKDIVLHLRIGDAIKKYNKEKDLFEYNDNYATKLETIKKNISMFKNKKILIFYGNHASWAVKKYSELYLKKIKELFKKNNIKFEERSKGNPDEDFLLMCNAKTFIKSGGGYSSLISEMVNYKNNKVIDLK